MKVMMNVHNTNQAYLKVKLLNNKITRSIIDLLMSNEPMFGFEIYRKLKMEQSMASIYLAKLERFNIIESERYGHYKLYALNNNELQRIIPVIRELSGMLKAPRLNHDGYGYMNTWLVGVKYF